MKKLIGLAMAGILSATLMNCSQTNPTGANEATEKGALSLTVNVSKVGATRSIQDIELEDLCLSISNGEETIHDTVIITGNGNIVIPNIYHALDVGDDWVVTSKTLDKKGVTIHEGVDTFTINAGVTTKKYVNIAPKFSMLRTNFFPIKDSVTKCELSINNAIVIDSSFAKQSHLNDTILLGENYIPASLLGENHNLVLTAYGVWGSNDTIPLYRGDTTITAISGNDTSYALKLKWVGPENEVGTGEIIVAIGDLGTIDVDGELIDKDTTTIPTTMIRIPAKDSTFTMGQTPYTVALPQVTFTYDFYMKSTEVTQEEFHPLMSATYPGYTSAPFTIDENNPQNIAAQNITWFTAILYCNALSISEGKEPVYSYDSIEWTNGHWCTNMTNISIDFSKNGYRLPTEAEWEYACRAGSTTNYYWGDDLNGDYMWYIDNHPDNQYGANVVATKLPNAFGLYDMLGNVSEWTNDEWEKYTADPKTDPIGSVSGNHYSKAVRGGAYNTGTDMHTQNNYCAYRENFAPNIALSAGGFRMVLPIR